ncbi:unnamed protein product, partial [Brassica oleracea]
RSDSFSRLSHHTWELMNSVDDEFESPKLLKKSWLSLRSVREGKRRGSWKDLLQCLIMKKQTSVFQNKRRTRQVK